MSWLPGQTLDRNSAITAMILADTTAEPDLREGHRLWPHIQSWAEELGLTAPTRSPGSPSRAVLPDAEDCDEGGVGDSDVGAL